jgi:hypothetical protein
VFVITTTSKIAGIPAMWPGSDKHILGGGREADGVKGEGYPSPDPQSGALAVFISILHTHQKASCS